jgi:hypothetical protein
MRSLGVVVTLVVGVMTVAYTQPAADPKLQGQMKHLFPTATFSAKAPEPPHF